MTDHDREARALLQDWATAYEYIETFAGGPLLNETRDFLARSTPIHESPSGERETDERRIIERARDAVGDMCNGRRRWTMSIPARPEHDHDLVITAALDVASRLLDDRAAHPSAPVEAGEVPVDLRLALTKARIAIASTLRTAARPDFAEIGVDVEVLNEASEAVHAALAPPVDETPSPDNAGVEERVCETCGKPDNDPDVLHKRHGDGAFCHNSICHPFGDGGSDDAPLWKGYPWIGIKAHEVEEGRDG